MKNKKTVLGVIIFLVVLCLYIGQYLSYPVIGVSIIPTRSEKGDFEFQVNSTYSILIMGLRVPENGTPPNCISYIQIEDKNTKKILLNEEFDLSAITRMHSTSLNKDILFDYYSITNIQLIGIVPNRTYTINHTANIGDFDFNKNSIIIRGLFH